MGGAPAAKSLISRHLPWLTAALGSLVLAAWLYRWWEAPFDVPFSYNGDALTNAMTFKAVLENGSIWNNDRLAAPFGQHFQDWPLTDLLPLYLGAAFAVLTGAGWAVAMNAFYILTFPAIAVSSWWVMRRWGVQRWVATALSIIYALAPYHFARGEDHIFLAGYFGVPLGAWIAVGLFDGELFARRSERKALLRYATWPTVRTLGLAVVITASSIYYAAFTGLMILIVVTVQLLRRRPRVLLPAGAVLLTMALTFVALAAPTFMYRSEFGPNVLGAQRSQSDTETYGLKLAQMVLPTHGHRVEAFRELRLDYVRNFPIPAEQASTAIGLVATAGLVLLLVVGLLAIVSDRARPGSQRQRQLSLLAIALFLIATVGGISTLISLFVSSQIRGWNRISIVIAFLALAFLGLVLTKLKDRYSLLSKSVVAAPLLTALVVIAALDQFPPQAVPPYEQQTAVFNADAEFFGRIEQTLPTGAAVFQLPVVPFPEPMGSYVDMGFYDPMRPYLHTDDLRWSYAGIEGRVEFDWQRRLPVEDPAALARAVVATGFDGIYVDRFARVDRFEEYEADLLAATGGSLMESANGRMAFIDLREYGARLREEEPEALAELKEELLFPVITQISSRDYRLEVDESGETFAWAPEDVVLPVVNETELPLPTYVDFSLETANDQPAGFEITWPDGHVQTVTGGVAPLTVSRTLVIPPGRSDIEIDSSAERVYPVDSFRVLNFFIRDIDVEPAESAGS